MRAYKPAALIFQQNPQDSVPSSSPKRPITICPPAIDDSLSPDPETEDVLPQTAPAEEDPLEEQDEVTQLFLRVQAECNMTRLEIRPMLDEIEEEQARFLTPKPIPPSRPTVRIENSERKEVSSSCVITFRSMGPVSIVKQKNARKKAVKQKKNLIKHPERIESLFSLVLDLRKVSDEARDWHHRGWSAKNESRVVHRLRELSAVTARQRRKELQRLVTEAQIQFPAGVKTNIEAFLREEKVNIESESTLQEVKKTLFPGLIKFDVKTVLCKYRGAVEFPYTSAFDSRPVIELLKQRKRNLGWSEALRRKRMC